MTVEHGDPNWCDLADAARSLELPSDDESSYQFDYAIGVYSVGAFPNLIVAFGVAAKVMAAHQGAVVYAEFLDKAYSAETGWVQVHSAPRG